MRLRDWTNPERDIEFEGTSYYYIGEFINEGLETHLRNFQSTIWGVDIIMGADADTL